MILVSSIRSRLSATFGECVVLNVRILFAILCFRPGLYVHFTDVNTESKRLKDAIITVNTIYFSVHKLFPYDQF